jgi:hypothetical protein
MLRKLWMPSLICSLALALTTQLHGQGGGTATILGTVTDSSGAMLPNAKVTITNTANGVAFKTTTTSAGDYSAPSLLPGNYEISVEAAGFQTARTTSLPLGVDQKVRQNIVMKPGAVTQEMEVTAQAVALDTDSAQTSQLMSTRQVNNLPLNGRNFLQLILLMPGAVTVGGEQGTMRQGEGNAISINGGRAESNNYTLDGLVNTDTALNTPAVILSQDAIQEFKVQTGTYSAEYGFSANQVNIISKSGGNSLHGSVFLFDRNNAFDAHGPFQQIIPELRQNQFGYVASGPVVIPKLYNGRNKTFWLANYEGWRIINGGTLHDAVPNPALLTGDFSLEPAAGVPAFGTAACSAALAKSLDCVPVDPLTGQPFPGNKIPTNRFSSIASTVISAGYFPTPNMGSNLIPGGLNRLTNYAAPLDTDQQTYRGDQNLGKLGTVFARFTHANFTNDFLNGSDSVPLGYLTQYEKQWNWEVSHTINLGPSNINNFRFGYLDAQAPQGGTAPPASAISGFGLQGIFTHFAPLQATWPSEQIGPYARLGGAINAYTGSEQTMWEFGDSFTKIHGNHTIGIGVDYRTWQLIRNLNDDFFGDYNFTSQTINTNNIGCTTKYCGTGNSFADFLLGYYQTAATYQPGPESSTTVAGNPQTHQFRYFAPYVQDDWKASSRLTLNLGLRWDFRQAPYEIHNKFFWLDVNNPNGGLCFADKALLTNGVAPPGNGVYEYCGARVPHPGPKTPFAPRFGFAYRLPDDKTVLRGGYGFFWDSSEGREIDDSGDLYPYAIRSSLSPAQNAAAPKLTSGLFPPYNTLAPIDPKSLTFIAVIESENPLNPYVQQWSLSVQRELARSTTVELYYVGTKGTHLLDRRNIAQPYPIPAADVPFCQANPTDVAHLCPTSTRLPYKNFTGFYINSDWHGYSSYNAFNVKFEHRTGNLQVQSAFTWAKSMDDKSAAAGVGATGAGFQGFQNNHDPTADYGPSDFDVDHRFVASYIYDLPVGRGQHFMGNASALTNALVGGWETTGIVTFQTGFPYSISATDVNGLLDTQFQRANFVPGCKIHSGFQKTLLEWFNTACFTNPPAGTFGNTSRNFLRQPGINNWDLGLGKSFQFGERVTFRMRAEAFNAFNHPQYAIFTGAYAGAGSGGGANPNATLGSPSFGQITQASPGRVVQLGGKLTF